MIFRWLRVAFRDLCLWVASRSLWMCGERDLAVRVAERSVAAAGLPGNYLDLIRMLSAMGRTEEARRWALEAVRRYPAWFGMVARRELAVVLTDMERASLPGWWTFFRRGSGKP